MPRRKKLFALLVDLGILAAAVAVLLVVASACSARPPDALPVLLFADSYEGYTAGRRLPGDTWQVMASEASATVSDSLAFDGANSLALHGPVYRGLALPDGLKMASYTTSIMLPELVPDQVGPVASLAFSWASSRGDLAQVASLDISADGAVRLRTAGGAGFQWQGLEPGRWHRLHLVANLVDSHAAAWIDDEFLDEVPIGNDPTAGKPRLQVFTLRSAASDFWTFLDSVSIYRGLLLPATRLRDCTTGGPSRSGDIVNVVFLDTEGLKETLAVFDEVVGWPYTEGSNLCLEEDDGFLRPQGAHRASHGSDQERWHARFYHDEAERRTLAALHRDNCGGGSIGHPCRFFQSHQGTAFFTARDVVARYFQDAGFDVSLTEQVAYIVLDRKP